MFVVICNWDWSSSKTSGDIVGFQLMCIWHPTDGVEIETLVIQKKSMVP